MLGDEFGGLRPQCRDRCGSIVEVDGEAIGLIVVCHEAEDIVVNVAEEVYLGLDAPVELGVLQRRVFVKEATIPATHLMVGFQVGILNVIML